MKVNFGKEINGVEVGRLNVGKTFLANRKSEKEKGLYMIVDSHSGLAYVNNECILAVNLESGQLRKFSKERLVEDIDAEVILEK